MPSCSLSHCDWPLHNRKSYQFVLGYALGYRVKMLLNESGTLKTLTSLNEGVRSFFLDDNSIWRFPSVSSLSNYNI